ncbi:MAG: hypothetical protein F4X92_00160 [Gammaproteobacteria bacterium]|nr:hypothetical protein [Gammaproteobacteria bacterium]
MTETIVQGVEMFAAGLVHVIGWIGYVFGMFGSGVAIVILSILAIPVLCFGLILHDYAARTAGPLVNRASTASYFYDS